MILCEVGLVRHTQRHSRTRHPRARSVYSHTHTHTYVTHRHPTCIPTHRIAHRRTQTSGYIQRPDTYTSRHTLYSREQGAWESGRPHSRHNSSPSPSLPSPYTRWGLAARRATGRAAPDHFATRRPQSAVKSGFEPLYHSEFLGPGLSGTVKRKSRVRYLAMIHWIWIWEATP